MGIQVVCPNGHALKVKSKYGGKVGLCPFCNVRMEIPEREGADGDFPRESSLSGLSIKAPDYTEDLQPPKGSDEVEKFCAKCHENVPSDAVVCPHCDTYIAQLLD